MMSKHFLVCAAMGLGLGAAGLAGAGCGGDNAGGTGGAGAGSATASTGSTTTTGTGGGSGTGGSGAGGGSPAGTPAWLKDKPLNEWFVIPGTSGAAGAPIDPWSGFAVREDTSELFLAASGGHSDSSDNRVVSIDLRKDAPSWVLRCEPSAQSDVVAQEPYYKDGKPASRHIYQHNHWVAQVNRVMMFGERGRYADGGDNPTVDGFNPDTNTWDPAGTWASLQPGAGYGVVKNTSTGEVWTNGLHMWNPGTKAWTQPIANGIGFRWPAAYDASRNRFFTLQWGDGQGYDVNSGAQASSIDLTKNTQTAITFNPSAAFTQFQADGPVYAAMDYDIVNDQFLFYHGAGDPSRVYVIKPGSGTTWDMTILALGPGSVMPDAPPPAGINGRFKYIPALKGFVVLPRQSANLFFLRTG